MIRTFSSAIVLAALPALVAQADPIRIDEIRVTTDLEAMEYNALDYWPEMQADIQNAIAQKVADFPGEVVYDVDVTIDAVSLNGSGLLNGEGEFNHLRGWVRAYPDGYPAAPQTFSVEMVATTDEPAFVSGPVVIVPPAEGEFYAALVDAFAAEAAAQLALIDSDAVVPGMPSDNGTAVPEAGADAETDATTGAEADAGGDADADAGAEADAGAGAEADAGTDAGTGAESGADTGADAGDGSETQSN